MIRKEDYLMVQIEAIGALIAKMLHLKTQGKQPELEALNVYTSTLPDPQIELLKNELKKRIARDKIFIAG